MKVFQYKCNKCKAEFEGMGGGKICPACGKESLKKTGERELSSDELDGCSDGCNSCKGCS